jgi:putative peptidoglycan lipid II flippase
LKVLLMGHLAQVGLAFATSAGAWINLSLLAVFARRQGFAVSGAAIGKPVAKLLVSGAILAAALLAGSYGLERALAGMTHFREETMLALLLLAGTSVYSLAVYLLLGQPWLKGLLREVSVAADTKAPPDLEQTDPTDDSAALPDNEPPPKA